jgi:hypothetical protein
MKNYVYLTVCQKDCDIKNYIVKKSKINDFLQEDKIYHDAEIVHINQATECVNGEIGKGDWIKSVDINSNLEKICL